MQKIIFLAFLAAALIGLSSWDKHKTIRGEGDEVTRTINVSTFDAMDIDFPLDADVTFVAGSTPSLKLTGHDNILAYLTTKVRDGKLIVSSHVPNGWSLDCHEKIHAEITMPTLKLMNLSGAVDVNTHGKLTTDYCKIDISGACQLDMEAIETANLEATVSGAGDIHVNGGHASKVSFDVSGAAKIRAYGLDAQEVDGSVSGAANVFVTAESILRLDVSGVANIKYKGAPAVKEVTISGLATVKKAE